MMVDIAIEEYPKIKSSAIEFDLPQPNYTINTLAVLEEKYPKQKFCLLMGEDNLKGFHKWKNYEVILSRYELFVYPRLSPNKTIASLVNHPNITKVSAPIMEISSTAIRKGIKNRKNIRPLLSQNVWQYLDEMNFYK
jgi:nicotinate-nucleotide adenylyltransferase